MWSLNIESKEYYKAKKLVTSHPSFYNHGRQTEKLKEGDHLEDQGLEGRITFLLKGSGGLAKTFILRNF